jgi:predicted transposase YbfD/YdcC
MIETKKSKKQLGENLMESLSTIKDPRINRKKKYPLAEVLMMAICAIIAGADSWQAIALFGKRKIKWLKKFMPLKNGTPSHDTVTRIFSILAPEAVHQAFIAWTSHVAAAMNAKHIAIDGKTNNCSFDKAKGIRSMHLVSAWASEVGLVLGQVKTDQKSNEITAIPQLLDFLSIEGCIITTDSMGTQKKIVSKIIEKKADYVMALKKNHPNIYIEIKMFFESANRNVFKDIQYDYHEATEQGHGRIETRKYWISSQIEAFKYAHGWEKLKSIGCVERIRTIDGKTTHETHYYITSLDQDVLLFAKSVRQHWGVESFHWVMDVVFNADKNRTRAGVAAQNFALAQTISLNMLKQEQTQKSSIRLKRLACALDETYLETVLLCTKF